MGREEHVNLSLRQEDSFMELHWLVAFVLASAASEQLTMAKVRLLEPSTIQGLFCPTDLGPLESRIQ